MSPIISFRRLIETFVPGQNPATEQRSIRVQNPGHPMGVFPSAEQAGRFGQKTSSVRPQTDVVGHVTAKIRIAKFERMNVLNETLVYCSLGIPIFQFYAFCQIHFRYENAGLTVGRFKIFQNADSLAAVDVFFHFFFVIAPPHANDGENVT
uniref:Uncharacterized protein n=1 Tax=Romanomermis culicivorax TaxID=13658 RepID=A0A915KBA2_ROMCU